MYKYIEEQEENNFNESINETLSQLDKKSKLLNIKNNKTETKLINNYKKKISNIKQNIIIKK